MDVVNFADLLVDTIGNDLVTTHQVRRPSMSVGKQRQFLSSQINDGGIPPEHITPDQYIKRLITILNTQKVSTLHIINTE